MGTALGALVDVEVSSLFSLLRFVKRFHLCTAFIEVRTSSAAEQNF